MTNGSVFHRMAFQMVVATDRSLAMEIRERLLPEIMAQFDSFFFQDQPYDTHAEGKGFRPGYVSFGLLPNSWKAKGLIGGILVRGTYPANALRSTAPESGTPEYDQWAEAGGNQTLKGKPAIIMDLTAGYYNKKAGGQVSEERSLGGAIFTIDELEEIDDFDLVDPAAVKSGIGDIEQEILKNPPDEARSKSRRVQQSLSPYTSVRKFRNYLGEEGRLQYTQKELDALHRETGESYPVLKDELRKRGVSLEAPKAASALHHPVYHDQVLQLL
jgi:hypothetical protein